MENGLNKEVIEMFCGLGEQNPYQFMHWLLRVIDMVPMGWDMHHQDSVPLSFSSAICTQK